MPALRGVLQRLAHVAELRTGEHVGALGHAGDIRLVYIGRGRVDAAQRFERMRAVDKAALGKWHRVECVLGEPCPDLPRQTVCRSWLLSGQRLVRRDLERRCNGGQSETRADVGVGQPPVPHHR